MPRRPLPDSEKRAEERLSRFVSRLAVGLLVVLGLALVLYFVA